MSKSSSELPKCLYSADQVASLENLAIQKLKINSYELMLSAGASVFKTMKRRYPLTSKIIVFAGVGNNAGDGYIVAAMAKLAGIDAEVIQLCEEQKLKDNTRKAFEYAKSSGVYMRLFNEKPFIQNSNDRKTIVIDAIFGTGLNRLVAGSYQRAITTINSFDCPIISVDLPSGLNSDTGCAMGLAVMAHMTVTFVGLKQGLLTGEGKEYSGEVVFTNLNIPDSIYKSKWSPDPSSNRIDISYVKGRLRPRRRSSHKGDHGHVVVLGGDRGFGGAGIMAAEAAMRSGAGLVTLVTRSEHRTAALVRCPELMVIGTEDETTDFEGSLEKASAIVVGPGLGTAEWGNSILLAVLESHQISRRPVLFDADAITLLSDRQHLLENMETSYFVYTPHPGEAAKLLGISKEHVQLNRFRAVRELANVWGGVCLLKGNGSLTCSAEAPDNVYLCTEGNAGMASGGMGDVLSGIIASLIAQGLATTEALNCGICIHGEAGDLASRACGERGLRATDLFPFLGELINPR